MRHGRLRIGWIATAAALALGCGPAVSNVGPAAAPAVTASAEVAPKTLPAAAESEDAAFRYLPPLQGGARAPEVTVEELTTAHGVPARLVESRVAPIVSASLMVRWMSAPRLEGTNGMFAVTLSQTVLGSGRTLREEVRDLGAQMSVWGAEDGVVVNLSAMPQMFEPSLAQVIEALRRGKVTAAAMENARKIAKSEETSDRGSPNIEAAYRWGLPRLFPSGHPFHFAVVASVDDAKKMKAEDLMRFRDAAVSLESISLAVAGAITKAELSDAIEKATSGWKASGKKLAAPAPALAGAFLVDDPDAREVGVLISLPSAAPTAADRGAARVAQQLFIDRAAAQMRELLPADKAAPGVFRARARAFGHVLDWFVTASNVEAKAIAEGMLRGIDDVVKGDVTETELASARAMVSTRVPGRDGLDALLYPLVEEMTYGTAAGSMLLGSSPQTATRADVIRLAGAMLHKDRVSLVAKGRVASEKGAFEKLGFAKVSVESVAKKGGKR